MRESTFYLEPGSSATNDWRHRAACREVMDPDMFFPIGSGGSAMNQIVAAKLICSKCPVRKQCLAWALRTNQDTGIWGGLCEEERRDLRRRPSSELAPV